jgi:hypothetical protein
MCFDTVSKGSSRSTASMRSANFGHTGCSTITDWTGPHWDLG